MKVGTDGVLIGAWGNATSPVQKILEIGTGTGLISLMMAQRFENAQITAIDVNDDAFALAQENAMRSKWKSRIEVQHESLQNFISRTEKKFDIMICNPPYFSNGWKTDNEKRKMARNAEHLPHDQLISAAIKNLSDHGSLNLILPANEAEQFTEMCSGKLYCRRKMFITAKSGGKVKRIMLEYSLQTAETKTETLLIENAGLNNFSDAYKMLTGNFYLNF